MRRLVTITLAPFLAGCAGTQRATPPVELPEIVLNDNGAWCWFQDERALIVRDKLVVASISNAGTVEATTLDIGSGAIRTHVLREDFDVDDHNLPGMALLDDGRVLALYARHHKENRMFYRASEPWNPDVWGAEQFYFAGMKEKFTYGNPHQLSAEGGRIYSFWRGIGFNPTWSASDDGGATWSDAKNVIFWKKGQRPYVKYCSNGTDTIHFAFTHAHPARVENSLFHAYYRGGNLYRSDGTLVGALADGPVTPDTATEIYHGEGSPTGRAWVWDMHLDEQGNPVIAYTSIVNKDDHRYRYARWDPQARAWQDQQIACAGTYLYDGQEQYSGGISLDPDDTSIVYVSADVDLNTGAPNASGHYEISRGKTRDGGATWSWEPVTINSTRDNLRPIVPADHPGNVFVLYYGGEYRKYTDYETDVVLKTDGEVGTR